MKIVCDACSAKYTIPDHKLKAKQNKVRCKKCGHTIVFSAEPGTGSVAASSEPAEQSAAAPSGVGAEQTGGDAQWFAAVAGEQTGPLTKEQLFALVATGQVDAETLVWREGMADWIRLAEVAELGDRPFAGGTAAFGAFDAPPVALSTSATVALSGIEEVLPPEAPIEATSAADGGTGSPLGDGGVAAALVTGGTVDLPSELHVAESTSLTAAPAAPAAPPVYADLFAGRSPSSLSGSNKMVAERSEDSVLFSLATLTQSTPAVKAGAAANEASGLIDIRVLASAAAPAQAGRAPVASIAAPVIPLPPRKKNTGLIVGAAVAGVAVVALAAAVVVVATRPAPVVEPAAPAPTVEVAAALPVQEVAAAPEAAPVAPAPPSAGSGSGVAVAAIAEAPAQPDLAAPAGGRATPRPADAAAPAAEVAPVAPPVAAPEVAAAPAAPAAPPVRKPDAAVAGVLSSLRGAPKQPEPAAPAAAPAAPEAPASAKATLTKDEVRGTIARYGSRVARCKTPENAGTTVKVSFSIDPSGSVSGVASQDGGEAGACIAGVVSGMKFKAFDGASIPITFPFKL